MGIGAKLDYLLKLHGSNPNELAAKIGVSAQTIYSMIKRDSKKADIEVLIRIAKELGVEPEYFCDSTDLNQPAENAYEDVERLIARNGKHMSNEQKMKLIQMLSDIKD